MECSACADSLGVPELAAVRLDQGAADGQAHAPVMRLGGVKG